MSPIGSSRIFLLLALLASILFAGAAGCSRAGDGSIAVQLVYPTPGAASSAGRPSVRAVSYATHPSDRILIRVLAPHFAPIERWFDRSAGRGEIGGIPPGTRITVEVDEYDNTAVTLGTSAPLLGRGWFNGITLSAGEVKTVPVAMYAKGTIVTICGAPPSGGAGTAGDNAADGILAAGAYLGNPTAVKAGPDDSIYISSSAFRKVKRIDRYGYLSHFAGDGTHGTIAPGAPAASAPIGAVQDIDIDPAGNLYLFNDWNQVVRVDNGVVNRLVYDNGVENSAARFNLAVVNVDLLYFVNYLDARVYRMFGHVEIRFRGRQPSVRHDGTVRALQLPPPGAVEHHLRSENGIARLRGHRQRPDHADYPCSTGTSTTWSTTPEAQGFLRASTRWPWRLRDRGSWTTTRSPGRSSSSKGSSNRVLYIDAAGKVRLLAGTGAHGFSGDGGPATGRRIERPAGDHGRLPRKRLHRRLRQPRDPHGRRRRPALSPRGGICETLRSLRPQGFKLSQPECSKSVVHPLPPGPRIAAIPEMIERLFASATMYATLAMFFDFPGDALHARLIARTIGRDVKCVLRQLQTLEACRIIVCRSVGRERRYRLSENYPLRADFVALFAKTRDGRYYPRQDGDPDGIDE